MSKKRYRRRGGKRFTSQRPARSPRLTTPEGDPLLFATAIYRHRNLKEIGRILSETDDFGLDEDLLSEPAGSFQFPWFEVTSGKPELPEPLSRRILATLTLEDRSLVVETISRQRLAACRHRLDQLLGARIQHTGTRLRTPGQVLREPALPAEAEPLELPPETIAEIEERMIRQWLDESIPALGGLTPREAVKTPEGQQLLGELLDYIARDQGQREMPPGVFSPDYGKARRMLGLE